MIKYCACLKKHPDGQFDADWIAVHLKAGAPYTFAMRGAGTASSTQGSPTLACEYGTRVETRSLGMVRESTAFGSVSRPKKPAPNIWLPIRRSEKLEAIA